jgi:hypothetical protein
MVAFTDETPTHSKYKFAVAESVGDVTFLTGNGFPPLFNEPKSRITSKRSHFSDETCTRCYCEVAVPESISHVTFVLRCFHGKELASRQYLTNENRE